MKFLIQEMVNIRDVKIVTPYVFEDDRGFFIEVFNKKDFEEAGIPTDFVQMNHSRSLKNVLRGLHFQWDPPMGKLMRVTRGSAYLVAVDIRKNSPTLGQYHSGYFTAKNKSQMWAPAGFARGIYTLEDDTEVQYLITGQYNPTNESQIKWDDSDLNISWPLTGEPIVSPKDDTALSFKEWLSSENSNNFLI